MKTPNGVDLGAVMQISSYQIRRYILSLPLKSEGQLTTRQKVQGERLINEFLIPGNGNYALFGGNSELIFALTFYCSVLPKEIRQERVKIILKKILADKPYILSENHYNGLEHGRVGILLALSQFYKLEPDNLLIGIISQLLRLIIRDARFYKKGITWFASDLTDDSENVTEKSWGIYWALVQVNKIFGNEFITVTLNSILLGKRNLAFHRTTIDHQKAEGVNSKPVFGIKKYISNEDPVVIQWLITMGELMTIPFRNEELRSTYDVPFSKLDGFSEVLRGNFQDSFLQLPSEYPQQIAEDVKDSCTRLDQYQMLDIMKLKRPEMEHSRFRIILRRLKLKIELINRSEIFKRPNNASSTFYRNCLPYINMPIDDFFNVRLSTNKDQVSYLLLKSDWLYSFNNKKKKLIACFSVRRYDRSIFINTDILDGFLPRLFVFLTEKPGTINRFKAEALSDFQLNINEDHLKTRLIVLIKQGVLVPADTIPGIPKRVA